jgi:sugar lactone lactonase YvrE
MMFRFPFRNLAAAISLLLLASTAPAQLVVGSYFDGNVYNYSPTGGGLQGTYVPAGTSGLAGPAGLAIGPDNNLYISSQSSNSILKYNFSNGQTTTFIDSTTLGNIAGAGNSYSPAGLKWSGGNLYVARNMGNFANPGTGAIDRFDSSGTFQGAVVTGLSQPSGISIQGSTMYFSNRIGPNVNGYGDVEKITNFASGSPGLSPFVATSSGSLENPTGITFGPDGKLYIADVGGSSNGVNCAVRRYNGDGSFDTVFNQNSLAFLFPSDVLFRDDGKLLVANIGIPNGYPGAPPGGIPGSVMLYNDDGSLNQVILMDSNVSPAVLAFAPVAEPGLLLVGVMTLVGVRRRLGS